MKEDGIEAIEQREDGLLLRGRNQTVLLKWEREDILRVCACPAGNGAEPRAAEGPMLDAARPRLPVRGPAKHGGKDCAAGGGPVEWRYSESEDEVRLTSARLTLSVDRRTSAFSWYDAAGSLLTREPAAGGRTLERITIERGDSPSREACRTRLDFEFQPGESLYGLGQHEEGRLDYRGRCQYLYQHNQKVALPLLLSSRGYGVLLHSYGLSLFHDDQFGSYLWSDAVDEMDFFFLAGPEPDQVIGAMRYLTGPAVMPPRWAFGYVQSKERYVSQPELLEVAREYRARGLPLDCIVLDWQSWPGQLWGQKSLDPERFPSPERLTRELHEMNVKLMVSIWPHMSHDGPDMVEMRKAGFLLGNDRTYDAFSPAARALYWKQANEGLFSKGIDAWWCDCSEPFETDWTGAVKPGPEERIAINTREARAYLDPGMLNAYSLLHSRGIWDGQRSVTREKRVVNLTRSAYPGQQRYGTFTWSGDISASWEILRRQIPEGINFCLSGLPYWTQDIGAFFVKPGEQWFWKGEYPGGCDDEGYRELFVRWFQYGAFLPMFRAHGTETPRELWRFGEPGSGTYETLARFSRLRYRLLPYLYSLAGAVWLDGSTMLRGLVFDFRADAEARRVEDQFMAGPGLMVCPVTRPQRFGPGSKPLHGVPESRPVYLPGAARWHDFWNGEVHEGGRRIDAAAPLETIPVFVRAGAIIPWGPEATHAAGGLDAALDIRVYPGADGAFTLYEDAGDGDGHERGEYARTTLSWNDAERTLTIGGRRGSYPGMPTRRTLRCVLMRPGCGQDNPPAPAAEVACEGAEIRVRL